MLTFNSIGIGLLIFLFIIETSLIMIDDTEDKKVREWMSNALLGILFFGTIFCMRGVSLGAYSLFYHYAFIKFQLSWWLWIAGFLTCDFINYFYHWLGHTMRIFWAAHVTHHSSEYFNISISFRNNFIHGFYRFLFWSPLCLFGIPPEMIIFFESVTGIQNYIVHTERVGKLGWMDLLFNTPSSHRVHHATNPEYIDKNFGGMTLLFDHLFGTFAKEVAKPVYGITHNIHTQNPYRIIMHEYVHIMKEMATIKGFANKIRYLFSPPD